ncbi:MAG: hypothetical protein VYC65_02905 [Chloroflexota bacterium]|nr:hypothetical protein [Chloroflexota bacterium]
MRKRFIVDFRIATSERDSFFTPNWSWPVKAETYDDPYREFVNWLYGLSAQLKDKPELRTAYELIQADLLHDLASITGTWIDVSTAKQQNLELIYGPDLQIYEMLDQDRNDVFSPQNAARIAGRLHTNNPVRRLAKFVKKTLKNHTNKLKGYPNIHALGVNPLLLEITGNLRNTFNTTYATVADQRPATQNKNPLISELAKEIQQQLSDRLADANHATTKNLDLRIKRLVSNHLSNGWNDRDFKLEFTPSPQMTLYTGTGGGYLNRTVAHAFQKNGASVIRTTHGGDQVLFNDPLWPLVELPFSDTYVTFGVSAAEVTKDKATSRLSIRQFSNTPSIVAAGSRFHQGILDRSSGSDQVRTVHVISASFSGKRRAIPNVKIHDIVYLDWHRRLLHSIKSAGFTTIAKRHPKGIGQDLPVFEDIASKELRQLNMADTADQADAFVFDIVGSAFMEALCTLKPVVLIEIPNRRLTEKARVQLKTHVSVVDATFDENNRVTIDCNQLITGLGVPVDLTARHIFISDYLTSANDSQNNLNMIRL